MASETDQPDVARLTVGVLGGTGDQGRGLAFRFGGAGLRVVLGSRDRARAEAAASSLGLDGVRGADNATCAREAEVVVVAVPWGGHSALLASLAGDLAGKVVVDCVNPLGFDRRGAYPLAVEEGSAAQQAAALLPDSVVVAAFHHVSSVLLLDAGVESVDTDVLVLGDDRDATQVVQALASLVPGMRGVYAGRLRNAGQVEALAANLISINRRYRTHAGVRVSGL